MKIKLLNAGSICMCLTFLLQQGSYAQMEGMDMTVATTTARRPLTAKSNEATKEQLAYARAEGDSVDNCTSWIIAQAAGRSGQLRAGEYKLTYALSAPEGWYDYNNQQAIWQQPGNANAHLWLFVQDGADGRIVPPLNIRATFRDAKGSLIEQKPFRFAWMPLVNGYGDNIHLPADGAFTLELIIAPPAYHRHDPYNGDRFTGATTAVIPLQVVLPYKEILSERMEAQQDLARKAGEAYSHTLQAMYAQANDGKDTTSGDYFLACAVEYAEGYWYLRNSKLVYKMDNELSAQTNGHVEIVARDIKTGRFLHDLNVTATLYDDKKKR